MILVKKVWLETECEEATQKQAQELVYTQFGLPRTPLRSLSPEKVIPVS